MNLYPFACNIFSEHSYHYPSFPSITSGLDGYSIAGIGPSADSVDAVLEVCGVRAVLEAGVRFLRPGGMYVLVGLVHPDSRLDITAESIIRKCLTIKGKIFLCNLKCFPHLFVLLDTICLAVYFFLCTLILL